MKRMICFVSHQILPNFIPLNETVTRPDVLHAFLTPSDKGMVERWQSLKKVIQDKFPMMKPKEIYVRDAYDAITIQNECEGLLSHFSEDEWSLNATGGTKIMSAPASELFRQKELPVYYVETSKGEMLKIKPDWSMEKLPFTEGVDLETYFALYGRKVESGIFASKHEKKVVEQLKKLDWQVWSNVKLYDSLDDKKVLAEYDAIGIYKYQMYAFECKRIHNQWEKTQGDILKDLYKLYQIRQSFGGPFGKSYWLFEGTTVINDNNQSWIKDFGITLIQGNEINLVAKNPSKFKLPPCRP